MEHAILSYLLRVLARISYSPSPQSSSSTAAAAALASATSATNIRITTRVLTWQLTFPWRPCFSANSELSLEQIIGPKFHEDWTINVTSRENCPPPGGHVFQRTGTIFNSASLSREQMFYQSHIMTTAPPPAIIETNVMTKFYEDWTINVTSKVLTSKTAPPPGDHNKYWTKNSTTRVFIKKTARPLRPYYIGTNTINVASRVLTSQNMDDGRRTKDDPKSSP
ncbi:hypothetical protein DPMN_064515 [Dreissena polymorpha]|uniref:Uncharacterized protein n=1 Tax=Dreissena polymorpha TaxID=45954 RepID=A0A9D4CCD3_DREPO|nr:hypothetical protein DPMN_064515 [Dreissena polymorpha]